MPVKSKDIPGFLGENPHIYSCSYMAGFRRAIIQTGEVSLRFNREKLANWICDIELTQGILSDSLNSEDIYRIADAIESNIQDIIEVCPADKERK